MASKTDLATDRRSATPRLQAGDRLSREEFERRFEAMPHVQKAELIEGVVYLPSPVSTESHGAPHAHAEFARRLAASGR